LHLHKIT